MEKSKSNLCTIKISMEIYEHKHNLKKKNSWYSLVLLLHHQGFLFPLLLNNVLQRLLKWKEFETKLWLLIKLKLDDLFLLILLLKTTVDYLVVIVF